MRFRSLLLAALLMASLGFPSADAQGNPCVQATWSDTGEVRNVVRPEVEEYRGRITFTSQAACGVTAGCTGTPNEATFEVVSPPDWVEANFTQNPVPVNGSTGPFGNRQTSNELVFRLDRTAPFESSFALQVRARCGTQGFGSTSKSFRVGPLVDLGADVISSAKTADGVQWILRITNSGNVPVIVEFEPRPSEEESDLEWIVPDFQIVPAAEEGQGALAVAVTIRVKAIELPENLSVVLRVGEQENEDAPMFEMGIELPYVVFSGQSTPWTALPALLLVLAIVARRRYVKA